jgi:Uncharacterized conserved protein
MIDKKFSICKVETFDNSLLNNEYVFIGKTDCELSIICDTEIVPEHVLEVEHGWNCFRIAEDAAFGKYGMIAFLTRIIADQKTGVLVVATYDTDYMLIKDNKFLEVKAALEKEGCRFLS